MTAFTSRASPLHFALRHRLLLSNHICFKSVSHIHNSFIRLASFRKYTEMETDQRQSNEKMFDNKVSKQTIQLLYFLIGLIITIISLAVIL